MAETVVSPDASAWQRIAQFFETVLPVTGSESLLRSLAEFWSRESGGVAAAVSAVDWDAQRLLLAYTPGNQTLDFHTCSWSRGPVWDPRAVTAAMARIGLPELGTRTATIPFGTDAPRGGIVLSGDAEIEDHTAIGAICGRLIEQARLVDSRPDASQLEEAKFEALAEFAAGAGHEINNPAATICGRVQLLLADETDPHRRQTLQTIGGQALRIRDMIGDLMVFGRPPQPELEPVSLQDVVEDTLAKLNSFAEAQSTQIETRFESLPPVLADPVQAAIVVSNLVRNSLEALRTGGTVVVSIGATTSKMVRLTVTDDGPGLTDEEREHLFDPFYSGRQAGRGLGFGLPKCRRIMANHGGCITVSEPDRGGLTVCTDWPAVEADRGSERTTEA